MILSDFVGRHNEPTFVERSTRFYLLLGGFLYLAIILLGLCGETIVRGSIVVPGDAAATASNISSSPLLWRAGIVGDLLMHLFDIPVIAVLYLLLRPVSEGFALLATFFNLVQTAILGLNKLTLLVPLFLQSNDAYLKAFSLDQLQALSQIAIQTHGHGFAIGLLFFGLACLVRGFLIFRCRFMPKPLGILLAIAGFSYLMNSFALLLLPDFAAAIFPAVLVPAFIGELSLCLWLICKKVEPELWEQGHRI